MNMQKEIAEISELNRHWLPTLEDEYGENADKYLAKGENFTDGVYYHNCEWPEDRKKILRKGYKPNKVMEWGNRLESGIRCGRDKSVILGFYTSDLSAPEDNIIEIKGSFNFISLMTWEELQAFEQRFDSTELMIEWLTENRYDGIRHYSPYGTGEEFILYNLRNVRLS